MTGFTWVRKAPYHVTFSSNKDYFSMCWCSNGQGTLSWCKTSAMNLKCQCWPGFYVLVAGGRRTSDTGPEIKLTGANTCLKINIVYTRLDHFCAHCSSLILSSILWGICITQCHPCKLKKRGYKDLHSQLVCWRMWRFIRQKTLFQMDWVKTPIWWRSFSSFSEYWITESVSK